MTKADQIRECIKSHDGIGLSGVTKDTGIPPHIVQVYLSLFAKTGEAERRGHRGGFVYHASAKMRASKPSKPAPVEGGAGGDGRPSTVAEEGRTA